MWNTGRVCKAFKGSFIINKNNFQIIVPFYNDIDNFKKFVDIIEVYANYFVKLSAKNHSPKNITVAVFKANIENLEKFRIKELKKLNDKDIEKSIMLNIVGTSNVVIACSQFKTKLIYFSTNLT